MPKILIIANSDDRHSQSIIKCLNKRGCVSLLWSPKNYVSSQTSYIAIDNNIQASLIFDGENTIEVQNIDVVWFRRPAYPLLPQNIHQNDMMFVKKENRMHMRALWLTLEETAVCINPFSSFDRANCKVTQLREAVRVGLAIPKTLISNNRESITSFINNNREFGTIYKTFSPPSWEEENNVFCFETIIVNNEMLPEQYILQLTPGIFQQRIKKSYELRVTFFGDDHIAIKIHNSSELDWRRYSSTEKISMSATKLPYFLEKQCLALMKNLGIVFACFDIIVTPDDEYIFLEVNEMGQFLWLDEKVPNLKMLDRFCDFLTSHNKMVQRESLNLQ